jgi:hypothetical protein
VGQQEDATTNLVDNHDCGFERNETGLKKESTSLFLEHRRCLGKTGQKIFIFFFLVSTFLKYLRALPMRGSNPISNSSRKLELAENMLWARDCGGISF